MSDISLLGDRPPTPSGGRRAPRQRRRGPGCLLAIIILAVLAGGGYFLVTKGIDKVKEQFSSAPDYSGPGSGSVEFEVKSGYNSTDIGRGLKAAGVVASVDSFIKAAEANPKSRTIQPGTYELKLKMKASDALDVLIDPSNIKTTEVVVPEGLRVADIVDLLVKKTGFPKKEFQQALKDPSLGLPSYANGNAEGYLFPATYDFGPKEKPFDMLHDMVVRFDQSATDNDLVAGAAALGYTPNEVMTMASLVEAEGRGKYRTKIARTLYNRIEIQPNPSAGFLQVDASINYALNRTGTVVITDADKDQAADSPYDTYTHKGLPPTPIESPGDAAIQAALHPAQGPWFFYVTVNLATGLTKFTDSYDQFLEFKHEYEQYCATQSDRC